MWFLRCVRERKFRHVLAEQGEFYQKSRAPRDLRKWQLDQFNLQWQTIRRDVPYYQRLCGEDQLPPSFPAWREFQERMPVMDRRAVQNAQSALMNQRRAPDFMPTTGGSTAEPVQIPAWRSEINFATKDIWYARSWYGVSPADKLFLLWGHSHLLGKGLRGRINGVRRALLDSLLGYYRHSAYDLSEPGLREAAEALLEFGPAYVVGYAVALDRFSRINRDRRERFHRLKLKVAIATAESFPGPDSALLIGDVLGCPVAMEYGSVETGPIAHQKPDGHYSVFWRHYFLEGRESTEVPGAYELFLTSLYPRCFPLGRYKLGDLISTNPDGKDFSQEFEAGIGRCNDCVILRNGGVVHSEAFTHAVKEISSILGYQVVQSPDGAISLRYLAAKRLEPSDVEEIVRRLNRVNPYLSGVRVERVDSLEQTIAGKTRRIVRQPQFTP